MPRSFRSEGERSAAYSVLVATLARYKFISDFVSAEDPGLHSGARFIWLTVRPPDDVQFEDLKAKLDAFVKKDAVVRAFWCYEQASTGLDDAGEFQEAYGFHFHCLFEFQNASGSMARTLGQHFRPWNVKFFVTPERFIDDKVRYMLGHKDAEKAEKCAYDELWRDSMGLESFYTLGTWPLPGPGDSSSESSESRVSLETDPTVRGADECSL